MKAIFLIFLMVSLSGLALHGQAPEKRFVGNCSFSGFALLSDSTYRGDIINFTDRFGDGYNLNQLAVGYEIFDGRGLVFEVDTIHAATNFTADVSVTAKINRGFAPFGSGQAYNPTENGLIPPSSQEQAGLSPTQKARIDRHNVVAMQSLIGGRDSVYSIATLPDTASLSPVLGDAFINATADTLGLYDGAGWVLFFGGSQSADGLTILGDGSGGDPFRVDTNLLVTITRLEDSLAAKQLLIDSLDNVVLYANIPSYVQVPPCEDGVSMVITGLIIDKTISIGDNISGDITFSGAPLTIVYVQEENGYAYFEAVGSVDPGIYGPEIEYAGITLSGLLNVVASNPDTVTILDPPGQDSILVTRVCGAEVSRDTIDVQHPFSTTSQELEIVADELKLAQQGANFKDALRWNGVDAYEPAPIQSIEYLTEALNLYVCNDTCTYTTLKSALRAASFYKTIYDSTGSFSANIIVTTNSDGSLTELNESAITATNTDFRGISISSTDTVLINATGFSFINMTSCTPPVLTNLKVRGVNNADRFFEFYTCSGVRIISCEFYTFRRAGLINVGSAFEVSSSRFIDNSPNYGIEIGTSFGMIFDCHFSGNASTAIRCLNNSVVHILTTTIDTSSLREIEISNSRVYLNNVDISTNLPTGITLTGSSVVHITSNSAIVLPQTANVSTDLGIIYFQDNPYPFQESITADEPDPASGIRYYYNLDSMAVMVTYDGLTWERLVSSSTATASGTTNRIPVFAGVQNVVDGYFLQASDRVTLDAGKMLTLTGGTTASRPAAIAGGHWYNTTLNNPQWSDGTSWFTVPRFLSDNGATSVSLDAGKSFIMAGSGTNIIMNLTSTGGYKLNAAGMGGNHGVVNEFLENGVVKWDFAYLNSSWTATPNQYGAGKSIRFYNYEQSQAQLVLAINGNTGIRVGVPTARLHLPAGTTAAGTGPAKFTSGSLLTTPEAGAIEFLTDRWYGTITTGAARKGFAFTDEIVSTVITNLAEDDVPRLDGAGEFQPSGITSDGAGNMGIQQRTYFQVGDSFDDSLSVAEFRSAGTDESVAIVTNGFHSTYNPPYSASGILNMSQGVAMGSDIIGNAMGVGILDNDNEKIGMFGTISEDLKTYLVNADGSLSIGMNITTDGIDFNDPAPLNSPTAASFNLDNFILGSHSSSRPASNSAISMLGTTTSGTVEKVSPENARQLIYQPQHATYYEEERREYILTPSPGADTVITVDTIGVAYAADSISISAGLIENLRADTVTWLIHYDFTFDSDEDACQAFFDLTTDGSEVPTPLAGSAAYGNAITLFGSQFNGRSFLVDVPSGQSVRLCVKGNVIAATEMNISYLTITIQER